VAYLKMSSLPREINKNLNHGCRYLGRDSNWRSSEPKSEALPLKSPCSMISFCGLFNDAFNIEIIKQRVVE
jgi:hypothetical protein